MRIIPINNYVVVRKEKEALQKTAGGLYIPQVVDENSAVEKASVKEVSHLCEQVSKGDTVAYPKGAATRFKVGDIEYSAIAERNLICKIEEDGDS